MKKQNGWKVLVPVIALFMCGVVVLMERYGVTNKYEDTKKHKVNLEYSEDVKADTQCLVLVSDEEVSNLYSGMLAVVLDGMDIVYDEQNASDFNVKDLKKYQTLILTFEDWSVLGDKSFDVCDWVKNGGSMLCAMTPSPNLNFQAVSAKLGIASGGTEYASVGGIRFLNNSMLGAEEAGYSFEEEMDIALAVELRDDVQVYMESIENHVPLLWKAGYGDGTMVVMNEILAEKYQRGFLCLAYSLLQDVCIYPVINGSAFYLDDFPSPVPGGNGEYIERDYGVDTGTFYSTIWWPIVMNWETKYGIKHTGLIIEEYSDEVQSPFDRNKAFSQFITYGNMLLNHGGELGFHGYNHMPLCLEGIDEKQQFGDYKLWPTKDDAMASLTELSGFSSQLFPSYTFSVYVPPSNIMSESGKEALLEACPDIRVIASTFLEDSDGKVCEQEFTVEENGIIDTPRITSGCIIDSYARLTAMSELNFQFVQSHFLHPDDVLDEDRGAELGWEKLSENFEDYLDWVYTSVPSIRDVTGSEMGTAVEQYHNITMKRKVEKDGLSVELGGFSKEAYFMLRVNEGQVKETKNCSIEHLSGDLYLVHATDASIWIGLGE